MTNTLNYIAQKFEIDINQKPPVEILKVNRTIMAQTLYELGFKVGAEIGVAEGLHSETLCKNNPDLQLYCIDAWEHYKGYGDYLTDTLNSFYAKAQERLSKYNCILIKKFSMDAANLFKDKSLDFVYIDGAHDFMHAAEDIDTWRRKVKRGGIVYGHDFKRSTNPKLRQHLCDVVPAYCYAYNIRPWFILGTRGPHDGQYQEGTRSWMWVEG